MLVLGTFSCDNELDLTSDWKDIPVVWGIWSADDSLHYIRVEKAFLDPSKSALELARIPDSLYYKNIVVELYHVKSKATYRLEKVDGNQEGYPRKDGIFAQVPNVLYRLSLPNNVKLNPGDPIQLRLLRGDNLPVVTANTTMVRDVQMRLLSEGANQAWAPRGNIITYRWNHDTTAALFDLELEIHLKEENRSTGEFTDRSLTWVLARNVTTSKDKVNQGELEVSGSSLYEFLENELPVDNGINRYLIDYDLTVYSGGKEMLKIQEAQNINAGLTGAQLLTSYTNMSEGLGVFTSRNKVQVKKLTLTQESKDSLVLGQRTRKLNFKY